MFTIMDLDIHDVHTAGMKQDGIIQQATDSKLTLKTISASIVRNAENESMHMRVG